MYWPVAELLRTEALFLLTGIYTDILCGFISSTARTVSNELISQLFGVGKVSADDLMEIARNRGLVPDEMLMACTLTASCAGDGLDSGLRKEVVLNLSRVEVKSTSTCDEPGESFLFVLHWEKVRFSIQQLQMCTASLHVSRGLISLYHSEAVAGALASA